MIGRIMPHIHSKKKKDIQTLIPGTYEYVGLHSKRELRLQIELSQSWDGEMILGHSGEPNPNI